MEQQANAFKELFNDAGIYLETKADLIKHKAVSKSSEVISSFVSRLFVYCFAVTVILFLNVGLALWVGAYLGAAYKGFFGVAAFYLLLTVVFWLNRKRFVKKSLQNLLIRKMLN